MQQGRKSSGGQGLPDRAAEEQATTRGRKRVRKAFQGRIFLRACIRFCPGTAYIVRLCARVRGRVVKRSNRNSVALATRLVDRVTVPPPHGAGHASQCSNTRIAATHTRPWSNIRDRIGRLCVHVRASPHSQKRYQTICI